MNPKVNGQMQKEWGWLVAVYLFLGGIGGGAYTIAAINSFVGESAASSIDVGLWIGFPALLIGCLFLLADLGSPSRAFLAGMKPGSSWIARGTWIICIFMVLSFLHLVLHAFTGYGSAEANAGLMQTLAVFGIVFAVGTMAYTGILLSASKGIPFWRSGVVPVVFVVSALVTGHFVITILVALLGGGTAETLQTLRTLAVEAVAMVVLEILVIVFFLNAAYKLPDPRESAMRILRRPSFVVGYFLLGLLAPAVLMLILLFAMAEATAGTVVAVAVIGGLLGLVGGLILRQAVLVCGAYPTLNLAGFEFRRIARPKEPKPGIGLMPPQ